MSRRLISTVGAATWAGAMCAVLSTPVAGQSLPPFLPEPVARALASEASGESAKRQLEFLTRQHRMRGSSQFRAAAQHIVDELRRYGLKDAMLDEFPADGKTFYGTQRSRPAWEAEFAELWEMRGGPDGVLMPVVRIGSFDAMPVTLAQDSESADVTADLVDVGSGTSDADYAGKDVKGKIVLASAQPGPVAAVGVARYGAAGIVSYAQNQRSAWWGEDGNLIRWGHLETFGGPRTFGFMVSLNQARAFQQRLARGERVRLHAVVKAGQRPGAYVVATASIPGRDPARRNEEIVYSCHLDHPRPGANDNASGCAAILEVARTLSKLIAEGRLPAPARTIRFVWPPEIEGTVTLLNARPEWTARVKTAIHLDMVGGGPETKAVFAVTRGPGSLPSFVNDVAAAIGAFVNAETMRYAETGVAAYPLTAAEGGREPLRAELVEFTRGSDHEVYTDSSFRIPAIYMNDSPDRYIHTNADTAAMIDPTKLHRAAFIAAASGWVLANLDAAALPAVWQAMRPQIVQRAAVLIERRGMLTPDEALAATRFFLWHERTLVESMTRFTAIPAPVSADAMATLAQVERLVGTPPAAPQASGDAALIFSRSAEPKGPMSVFGYDYFSDKYGSRESSIRLLQHDGARGSGADYGYEVLNLADGTRSAQRIRDDVSAIYGPVPLDVVVEYLKAAESIGVLTAGSAPR